MWHGIEPWLVFDDDQGELRQLEASQSEGFKRATELLERLKPLAAKEGFQVTTAVLGG